MKIPRKTKSSTEIHKAGIIKNSYKQRTKRLASKTHVAF